MKMGVASRVLDEDGNIIGNFKYIRKTYEDYRVWHRSPSTGEDLAYLRSRISGTLNDGRKFKGTVDEAVGVINSAAWEQKYGIPSSIPTVKFSRR